MSDRVENQRWIANKLRSCRMVQWDRFTVGDWNGEQSVSVYGWIDREDPYKDFVLLVCWPESESIYHITSSAEYSEELTQCLHGDSTEHNECRRVENTFNVSNSLSPESGDDE